MLLLNVIEKMKNVSLDEEGPIVESEIKKNETVIGTIENDELKKIFLLRKKAYQKMNEFSEKHQELENDGREETLKKEYLLLKGEHDLLDSCFWNSLYHEMPDALLQDGIGIRKDWQVVAIPHPERSSIIIISGGSFPFCPF